MVAIGLWLVIKVVPEQLASTEGITDPSKHAEEVARTRTAVLASLVGILAAIGAYYTHRTFDLNRQGHELNRQGQITERFTRAVEQLGHDSLDVRVGGLYALERLAHESSADHGPIIEILTAYVREHAAPIHHDRPVPQDDRRRIQRRIATDLQAAITALGRRTVAHDPVEPWHLDLGGVHLERARLYGAHLERANLYHAHLERANLSGAHLDKANLIGAHLNEADLHGAHLKGALLHGAHLDGANLLGAHLEGARLYGAHLNGANLDGATWSNSTVWPEGAIAAAAHGKPSPHITPL